MVSNHEFFNVLSPNGPLCPCSALPGSRKIIEDLSQSIGRGDGGRELGCRTGRGLRGGQNERMNN